MNGLLRVGRWCHILFILLLVGTLSSCTVWEKTKGVFKKEEIAARPPVDSLSYALGMQLGSQMKAQGFDGLRTMDVQLGLEHALENVDTLMDTESAVIFIEEFLRKRANAESTYRHYVAQRYLRMKLEDIDVHRTESGLLYEALWHGDGQLAPDVEDMVAVQIEGQLTDGTVIESSYETGRPIKMMLQEQIPGLCEGIGLMQPGAKYRFYLSPELAFGERGNGMVGAWEVLIYEVELIDVLNEP